MEPDRFYHIFNHANGDESLYREEANYYFFLRQWSKYIEPVAKTYAYCLMPNHFHFLVRTETSKVFENLGGLDTTPEKLISKAFSNLFNSYTKAFNKRYSRKGSLFMSNFKKKEVDSDSYLTDVIVYIHQNPMHHGFTKTWQKWSHSSYQSLLSDKLTKLAR
ncbi:MAG: transposase [Bacteroidota bacterium]